MHAATEAIRDAGLLDSGTDRSRIGVFLGAGTADLLRNESFYQTWITAGLHRTRPSDVWNHFPSTSVDVIAERFGLEGPRGCVVAACSSSTIAIGRAADAVRDGRAAAVLAGGTDALARLTFSGFNQLKLMDPAPCRPFDKSRAGMSIGEGAGILVLENLEHAVRRGATIYAELGGLRSGVRGVPSDGAGTGGPAGGRGHRRGAGRMPGSTPSEIDHINAHGTATAQNDAAEARAFRRVFGERAAALPVTSLKSMIGHCLGAAGAVEAAALALTIARGAIPPTIHHSETDAECALDIVANQAREQRGAVRCVDVARPSAATIPRS